MRLVEVKVEEITKRERTEWKNTKDVFDEFMAMNVKAVEVQYTQNDYSSFISIHTSFRRSLKNLNNMYPITIKTTKGKVYLVRKDL